MILKLGFLCLLGLTLSCEFDTRGPSQGDTSPISETRLNQEIQPITDLSSNQKNIAQRLCENLKVERLKLRSLPNGTARDFRVEEKSCPNGRILRNTLQARLEVTSFGYSWETSQNINLHGPILTDRSSVFDQLCEEIDSPRAAIENTQLISSRQVQFNFKAHNEQDLDSVQLISYQMDNGSWRAKEIDEYDISRGSEDSDLQGQTLAQRHRYFCNFRETTGELVQVAL